MGRAIEIWRQVLLVVCRGVPPPPWVCRPTVSNCSNGTLFEREQAPAFKLRRCRYCLKAFRRALGQQIASLSSSKLFFFFVLPEGERERESGFNSNRLPAMFKRWSNFESRRREILPPACCCCLWSLLLVFERYGRVVRKSSLWFSWYCGTRLREFVSFRF